MFVPHEHVGGILITEIAIRAARREKANVDRYLADPMCGFTFTVNGFETLFKLVHNCYDEKGLRNMPKDLPVFLVAGAQDPVYRLRLHSRSHDNSSVDPTAITKQIVPQNKGAHAVSKDQIQRTRLGTTGKA